MQDGLINAIPIAWSANVGYRYAPPNLLDVEVTQMKYISTRGNAPAKTFTDILLGGLAPDGGLYLPEHYPQVTRAELDAWRKLSYADLAFVVLSKFATDIPAADLKAIICKTYTAQVYCNGRADSDAAQITPLRTLGRKVCTSLNFPTARRWRSRIWRCNCSATCSNTRWRSSTQN